MCIMQSRSGKAEPNDLQVFSADDGCSLDARAARRELQRARVIAAVRRFECEHGRLPRALEFFRWRYEQAIDAPTQATVYKLFPDGFPEVLAEARQLAGATV